MLILTRRVDQNIVINDGAIKIKVMRVRGKYIDLGFEAAFNYNIDREEIFIKKQAKRISDLGACQ